GDIRCRLLIVGVNARITGSIQADVAKIHGNVNGVLCARSVFLATTAKVNGDITHERLEIEQGAYLEGNCRHMDDPIPAEQGPADLMLTDERQADKK
ncbi:MAG TPA: cell shape determination protein CcmA, partial [Alphaproteobacteria bacterium]|nr:cell shape determination protein CcmA [Alphaproteobacteria bacterium]